MAVKIKRAYEDPAASDGYRILVDRLWPRGVKKEALKADMWLKEIAPTTELRKWFAHDPKKWPGFVKKYQAELDKNKDAVDKIKEHLSDGKVTLIYAAKDQEHNEAVVLQKYLDK